MTVRASQAQFLASPGPLVWKYNIAYTSGNM